MNNGHNPVVTIAAVVVIVAVGLYVYTHYVLGCSNLMGACILVAK